MDKERPQPGRNATRALLGLAEGTYAALLAVALPVLTLRVALRLGPDSLLWDGNSHPMEVHAAAYLVLIALGFASLAIIVVYMALRAFHGRPRALGFVTAGGLLLALLSGSAIGVAS